MQQSKVGPVHTCQWIEGEPDADESCKCGRPAIPARPYCREHEARAWRMRQDASEEN